MVPGRPGLARRRFRRHPRDGARLVPQGSRFFRSRRSANRRNYSASLSRHSYRQQGVANLFLPTLHFRRPHQLKFGIDFEREAFHQKVVRHDYEVQRDDGSVARHVTF